LLHYYYYYHYYCHYYYYSWNNGFLLTHWRQPCTLSARSACTMVR
jgi:hypothetical protein